MDFQEIISQSKLQKANNLCKPPIFMWFLNLAGRECSLCPYGHVVRWEDDNHSEADLSNRKRQAIPKYSFSS